MNNIEHIKGVWRGFMGVHPFGELNIIVKFYINEGNLTIISPDGNDKKDFPLTNIQLNNEEGHIEFKANVEGQVYDFIGAIEKKKISGAYSICRGWESYFYKFEISQEKTKNFIDIQLEKGTLKAQIEIPSGEGRFPLVVFVAGSSLSDRNGNSILLDGKNDCFKMIAEDLLKHGIASIRYDKRGIGMNKAIGERDEDFTVDWLIKDAVECIKYAKNDERFSSVGVMGHSDGSLIGMLATLETNADFFISLAGFGRRGDQIIIEQLKSKQLSNTLLEESKIIIDKLNNNQLVEKVSSELLFRFNLHVQPYLISWFKYDPSKIIQNIKVPILIVNGKRDIIVNESNALSLHESNPKSTLLLIENMNHILKDSPLDSVGNMLTYSNPELPLSDGLMEKITNFILENASK